MATLSPKRTSTLCMNTRPSACDDVIRGAHVSRSRGLPHREVTDGLRRPPPSTIHQCPRADSWLLRDRLLRGVFDRLVGVVSKSTSQCESGDFALHNPVKQSSSARAHRKEGRCVGLVLRRREVGGNVQNHRRCSWGTIFILHRVAKLERIVPDNGCLPSNR